MRLETKLQSIIIQHGVMQVLELILRCFSFWEVFEVLVYPHHVYCYHQNPYFSEKLDFFSGESFPTISVITVFTVPKESEPWKGRNNWPAVDNSQFPNIIGKGSPLPPIVQCFLTLFKRPLTPSPSF